MLSLMLYAFESPEYESGKLSVKSLNLRLREKNSAKFYPVLRTKRNGERRPLSPQSQVYKVMDFVPS